MCPVTADLHPARAEPLFDTPAYPDALRPSVLPSIRLDVDNRHPLTGRVSRGTFALPPTEEESRTLCVAAFQAAFALHWSLDLEHAPQEIHLVGNYPDELATVVATYTIKGSAGGPCDRRCARTTNRGFVKRNPPGVDSTAANSRFGSPR